MGRSHPFRHLDVESFPGYVTMESVFRVAGESTQQPQSTMTTRMDTWFGSGEWKKLAHKYTVKARKKKDITARYALTQHQAAEVLLQPQYTYMTGSDLGTVTAFVKEQHRLHQQAVQRKAQAERTWVQTAQQALGGAIAALETPLPPDSTEACLDKLVSDVNALMHALGGVFRRQTEAKVKDIRAEQKQNEAAKDVFVAEKYLASHAPPFLVAQLRTIYDWTKTPEVPTEVVDETHEQRLRQQLMAKAVTSVDAMLVLHSLHTRPRGRSFVTPRGAFVGHYMSRISSQNTEVTDGLCALGLCCLRAAEQRSVLKGAIDEGVTFETTQTKPVPDSIEFFYEDNVENFKRKSGFSMEKKTEMKHFIATHRHLRVDPRQDPALLQATKEPIFKEGGQVAQAFACDEAQLQTRIAEFEKQQKPPPSRVSQATATRIDDFMEEVEEATILVALAKQRTRDALITAFADGIFFGEPELFEKDTKLSEKVA